MIIDYKIVNFNSLVVLCILQLIGNAHGIVKNVDFVF
jgi:hypothetical protein